MVRTQSPSAQSKVAVVTGAASGIGAATAIRFDRAGYQIVLVDREEGGLKSVSEQLTPGRYQLVCADVSAADAAKRIRDAIPKDWGDVAILVNNAGISPKRNGKSVGLIETDDELWELVLSVNLGAAFRLCRAFIPGMQARRWGRIVNISSQAGRTKSAIAGPSYMASKSGMHGLTRSIATEFAAFGITANCIAPGRIETGLARGVDPAVNEQYRKIIPVQRFGTSDEVAAAVLFLASEDSGFVTGAILDVNGGFFMA